MAEPKTTVTDGEIVDFLREVALEGYCTDDRIVQEVGWALHHEHPGEPDLQARIQRLAPALFDELAAAEASWPIPTDNDRLDRAFATLAADDIRALQNWYGSQVPADEEMRHEILFARQGGHPYRGFVFFHGGDIRRAIAGEGLRLTFGSGLPRNSGKTRLERSAWEIAQEIHRALWEQGLSPEWSRVVGDPITLPFAWRRRRKRYPPPPRPEEPPSADDLEFEAELRRWEAEMQARVGPILEKLRQARRRHGLRLVKPPPEEQPGGGEPTTGERQP